MSPSPSRSPEPPSKAHRTVGAIAMTIGALAACNAIAGLDDDYVLADSGIPLPSDKDGSSGGSETSSGSDGSSSGDDGSVDGGKDAAKPPADASAPLDCTNPPGLEHGDVLFCDNFEDTTGTPANNFGWTSTLQTGGAPTVEAAIGRNGTRGLRAKATTSSTTSVSTGLKKSIPLDFPLSSTYWLSFYFSVKSVGIDYSAIGAIQLATGGRTNASEHGVGVYNNAVSVQCPNDGGPPCYNENDQIPGHKHDAFRAVHVETDRWYYAEVFVTRNANGAEYAGKVVVDGQTIKTHTTSALLDGGPTGSPVDFIVGVFYSGTTNPQSTEVIIDDVVVRQQRP